MKKDRHPKYQRVVFEDSSNGKRFVIRAAMEPKETTSHNGEQLPFVRASVSAASHPYFTGDQQFVDTEGRIDRFKNRYKSRSS